MTKAQTMKPTQRVGIPRSRKPAAPFNIQDCLARAEATLAGPPARPHIERTSPKPGSRLVERFALPLSVCAPQNRTRHGSGWQLGKLKSQCMALMKTQMVTTPQCPLSGRPQVLAVRFSSVESDPYCDFGKIPVDCLKKLGLIVDDRGSCIELRQWWEPAAPKRGFVLVEVWSEEKGGGR